MALGDSVRIRLSERQQRIYEAEAEGRGVPISTYLREKLEEAERTLEELGEIRATLGDIGDMFALLQTRSEGVGSAATGGMPPGTQLEMLLLLRAIAGVQKANMISAEVKRLGLETIDIEEAGNAPGR